MASASMMTTHGPYILTKQALTQLTRLGANDPDFNLRRDPALLLRRRAENTTFVTAIEPHGTYSPVTESASNARSAA